MMEEKGSESVEKKKRAEEAKKKFASSEDGSKQVASLPALAQ